MGIGIKGKRGSQIKRGVRVKTEILQNMKIDISEEIPKQTLKTLVKQLEINMNPVMMNEPSKACKEKYCVYNTHTHYCIRCLRNKISDKVGVEKSNIIFNYIKQNG